MFACHAIDNPDIKSELQLLRSYAPNLDPELLLKLARAFYDLRQLTQDGVIAVGFACLPRCCCCGGGVMWCVVVIVRSD